MGDSAYIKKNSLRADSYFHNTRQIVLEHGDCNVTYALFMRRPVISAPRLAIEALKQHAAARDETVTITERFKEGDMVGAGEVIFYYSGKFSALVDAETRILQLLGPTCVAAYNAYTSAVTLPNTQFIAMDGRHSAGHEMMDIMAYAASIGSKKAQNEKGAQGFIGTSTEANAHYFASAHALGTMPHSLIGYAGNTLDAAKLYKKYLNAKSMTVLIDYFAKEITDAILVAQEFAQMSKEGKLALRIDTPSGRFIEGLDIGRSYKVLDRFAPQAIREHRTEAELKFMVGGGVSAAAVWLLRSKLDEAGFKNVKIVASSGFTPKKCRAFALTNAPADTIGTGSFIPEIWTETYATADVVEYNGKPMVKVGREFLQQQCGIIK